MRENSATIKDQGDMKFESPRLFNNISVSSTQIYREEVLQKSTQLLINSKSVQAGNKKGNSSGIKLLQFTAHISISRLLQT